MSTTAQQEVTTPVKSATGEFVWHELRTTDAKGAEEFYTHVVGWQAKPSGDPGGMPYTILSTGSHDIAGLMQLTPAMLNDGLKPAWMGFLGVKNVDDAARQVEQGGRQNALSPQRHPNGRPLYFRRGPAGRGVYAVPRFA